MPFQGVIHDFTFWPTHFLRTLRAWKSAHAFFQNFLRRAALGMLHLFVANGIKRGSAQESFALAFQFAVWAAIDHVDQA